MRDLTISLKTALLLLVAFAAFGAGPAHAVTSKLPAQEISPEEIFLPGEPLPTGVPGPFGAGTFTTTTSDAQAGSHPDLRAGFLLNTDAWGNPSNQLRNASVVLPAGIVGNPQAIERCPTRTFEALGCPATSQIGLLEASFIVCRGIETPLEADAEAGASTIVVKNTSGMCASESGDTMTLGTGPNAEQVHVEYVLGPHELQITPLEHSFAAGEPVTHIAQPITVPLPLFNLQPSAGHLATFGSSLLFIDIFAQVDLRPDGRLAVTLSNVSTLLPVGSAGLRLWGVPAESSHDLWRCDELGEICDLPGGAPSPLTRYPTDCSAGPLQTELVLESWQGRTATSSTEEPAPSNCGVLQFSPALDVTPASTQRDTPSGYTVDVNVPQNQRPNGIATPDLRDISVTFPAGASLSPALAGGLQTCSDAQFAADACPNAAKVGTAQITTPLLAEHLTGGVYLGEPTAAEPYRVLVSVHAGAAALHLTGQLEPNPATGQVTAVFENAPQLPFSDLRLSLVGGPSAAFANPTACGPATSTSLIASYGGQTAAPSSTFTVDGDGHGGACPVVEPFSPSFHAGTTSPVAGSSSPFSLTIARGDGEQALSSFSAQLPPGLVGLLKSVAPCPEPQASSGECPQSAQVGTATVAAGSGSQPLDLSGPVYLTGPYGDAPFGLTVAIPASAGPFNLGTAVIRSRVYVDPTNLDLKIDSDPLPQMLGGIPLRVQAIHVALDRPGFTVNPTSCAPQSVTGTLTGAQGTTVAAAVPFRVADCAALRFAPRLSASTQAHASSQGNGAQLAIDVTSSAAAASIKSVAVTLPPTLRPRLTTIQHACLPGSAPVLSACSEASIVGTATVLTPALPGALTGAVYLVAHGGTSLPSLVLALHGDGISAELQGHLAISRADAITAAFDSLPDVPFEELKLDLAQGTHSILGAIGSLCGKTLALPYSFGDQSGASINASARVTVNGCATAAKAKKASKASRSRRRRERSARVSAHHRKASVHR